VAPAGAADAARSAAAKREVTRAYEAFVRSAAAGHGRAACARLTAGGRAELMRAAGLWSRWRGTCPEAVRQLRPILGDAPALSAVRIFGTRAAGRVGLDHYRLFVRAGKRWKVAGTAATNILLPPAPPARVAPPQFLGVDWDRADAWLDDAVAWAQDASRWRWFAHTLAVALVALALMLALRARRYRRQVVALERSLEELTARAHQVLSASLNAAAAPGAGRSGVRHDLASLTRANRELAARLDEVQSRSDDMSRRLLSELARTGDGTEHATRLQERLARSESARLEAQTQIDALQEHVRRLRERTQLPEQSF
jgi:signal transduction histidine kinase